MADDPLDSLRLSLMQDVLPVGLAMVERARQGGASKVVEAFTKSDEPLQGLRDEGESAAKSVRERLDQVSPGLGNPVVPVNVEVDEASNLEDQDQYALQEALARIEERLKLLKHHLQDDSEGETSASAPLED